MTTQAHIRTGFAGLTKATCLPLRGRTGAWMVMGASREANGTSLAERWKG
jgi:hypothetical protein